MFNQRIKIPINIKKWDIIQNAKSAYNHISGFSDSNSFLSEVSEIIRTFHSIFFAA